MLSRLLSDKTIILKISRKGPLPTYFAYTVRTKCNPDLFILNISAKCSLSTLVQSLVPISANGI